MVLFNHATREMTAKIVYYGPGLCGKTTNLMVIFDKLDPKQKGKMLSLQTKTDRTLFFDLLPVDLGRLAGFKLKIQLYTVPGQVFYNETRKLVLRGADSVVFVADSQAAMIEATKESFANLLENLQENDLDPNDIPIVIQYNKRDLPGVPPVDELAEALGLDGYPSTEASALKGTGVMETFKLVTKITAKHLMERMKRGTEAPKVSAKAPAAPAGDEAAVEKASSRAAEKVEREAEVSAEPAPVAVAESGENPFGATEPASSDPFPEAAPLDAGYEKMEEVSLDQLLEGRERPLTIGGSVRVPLDDIEELPAEQMIDADFAEPDSMVRSDGDRVAALQNEVEDLRARIQVMRSEQRDALESILRELNDLTTRVRERLDT